MALPLAAINTGGGLNDDAIQAILRAEGLKLTTDLEDFEKYRDYYEGDQTIVYATDEWKTAFGKQFSEFRDNWCQVVVDAVTERLDLERIRLRSSSDDTTQDPISNRVWNAFLDNEFEQIQTDLYNYALVESKAYVVVWPDPILGVRIDVNPAQFMRVTYDPNDRRKPKRAFKRWITEEGETRLTLYTDDFIYKYKLPATQNQLLEPLSNVPTEDTGFVPRLPDETGDPAWPLPNPFGVVPVVEFPNRTGQSEISNVVPVQDLINVTLANMAVSGEFGAFRQRFIVSSNKEPAGGWRNSPGYVWHLQPEVDIEGRPLPTQVGSLEESDPSTYISVVEMLLQHVASITRTPHHMFFLTSKGGSRGDAPSGESLRVAETGLVKKIQSLHRIWGLRWTRVARLAAFALNNFEGDISAISSQADITWAHPMAHFRTILLEEGRRMIDDLLLPPEIAWRHIGLSEPQIAEASAYMAEQEAKAQAQAQLQAQSQSAPSSPPSDSDSLS